MLSVVVLFILVLYVLFAVRRPGTALMVLPIAIIACIGWSLRSGDPDITTLALLIIMVPAILITIAVSARSDDRYSFLARRWARGILSLMGYIILMGLAVVFGPLGLSLLPVWLALIARYIKITRNAIALHVISTIGAAMRQNLPLAMALQSAAGNNQDKRAAILLRISKWLTQGYSLSDALTRGYSRCPAEAVAMIKAAERIDQVPEAIRSIEADMIEKADDKRRTQPMSMLYPLVVIYSAFMVIFGLCVFIIPVFAEVLSEMSGGTASLPVTTRVLLSFTEKMMGGGWVIAILIITFLPLWGVSVFVRYRWRRSGRLDKPSMVAGFAKWHLPFVHWFELNYSLVKVVGLLKASLRAGCTVDQAIAGTLGLHINPRFRKRLAMWLSRVESGENIAGAARASRIPNAIAWAFDDKINKGNTLTILDMLEDFYRSNYNYKANMARAAMTPATVVLMGSVVGFVIYAMFATMVSMTSYMISDVTP